MMHGAGNRLTRRTMLGGMAGAPMLAGGAWGQDAAPADLPLRVTLLEHVGTVVPDVEASARFHSALFNPAIRTEMQPDPLRLYVDVNGGYLAFGSRANAPRAFIDHFCVLVDDYDSEAVAARLRADGIDVAANWPAFGLYQDPDGIGVQLVAHPGGWFPTVIDAEPLVEGPPLVTPRGLSHCLLNVADMGRSLEFYRRYFGPEAGADAEGRVWFAFGGTRVGLRPAPAGREPGIDHLGIRTAAFDRPAIAGALDTMGASVTDSEVAAEGLRFTDPAGLVFELDPAAAA